MSVVAAINGANSGAATTTAPTNGVALGQPSTAAPPPVGPASPTGGATGAQPAANAAPPVAKPPEPYRFKKEITLGGKKVAVELDELGLEREIATGRSAQQQLTRAQKQLEQSAKVNELLDAGDFEALAKLKGIDFEAILAERHERAEALKTLTPEQQEIVKLREQIARSEQQQQAAEQQRQQQTKQAQRQATQERTRAELFESLKHVGYKLDGPENNQARGQALGMAAKLQKAAILAGRPPLTPQQLGAEVTRSFLGDLAQAARAVTQHPEFRGKHGKEVGAVFESLTTGLEGNALLDAMGPALLTRVVQAQLAQIGRGPAQQAANNGLAMQQPGGIITAPPTPTNGKATPLDFYSLEAEVRKARGG